MNTVLVVVVAADSGVFSAMSLNIFIVMVVFF